MRPNSAEFHEKLTAALHERGMVVQLPDSQWSVPTLAEALRMADFVVEFLAEFHEPE